MIECGLYCWVCYFIYIGLLMGFFGMVCVLGEWCGLFGIVIVGVLFWFKLKLEECWMCE